MVAVFVLVVVAESSKDKSNAMGIRKRKPGAGGFRGILTLILFGYPRGCLAT